MEKTAQAHKEIHINVPSYEEIRKAYAQGEEAVVQLIMKLSTEYKTAITALQQRQQALEDQINKNSTNSSKPPSTDGYKKKNSTESLRKKSGKKARKN